MFLQIVWGSPAYGDMSIVYWHYRWLLGRDPGHRKEGDWISTLRPTHWAAGLVGKPNFVKMSNLRLLLENILFPSFKYPDLLMQVTGGKRLVQFVQGPVGSMPGKH